MDNKALFSISVVICFMMAAVSVMAVQPTQQYNQIFLSPFVLPAMTNNQNYSFLVNVDPPDGLSSVKSAIISFDIYMTPSVNFTLLVNGNPCNTQFFYVSTTYASSGQGRIKFDCSNRITKAGTYSIILRPSGANTGSTNGWLDFTYMNNPKMENLFVSGTEYNVGDYATIFLQLKDSQGTPINNGQCYLDIYYPSYGNLSHPTLYNDIGMLYRNGSNGIYYFDMTIPNVTGVYMLGATCAYSYDVNWIYPLEETVKKPLRTVIAGSYAGDTLSLNSYEDSQFTSCASVAKICDAYYDFNTTEVSNISSLDIYYMGETDKITTMTMMVWNWTSSSWITLPNTLTFTPTTTSIFPVGLGEMLTNSIVPSNHTINYTTKNVRIRLYTTGPNSINEWDNWLTLKFLTQEGQIQELKGSGELHVSNALSNLTVSINATQMNEILGNLSDIKNYLIVINGTTYQINQSQTAYYLSLLNAINSVNSTVINSNAVLYSLILNISVNETALLDAINHVGLNLTAYYGNLTSLLVAHNVSMAQLINALNQSQNNNYAALAALVDSHNLSMTQLMLSINQSNAAYFNDIEGQLGNLSAYMAAHNQTIYDLLVAMNGSCEDRKDEVLAYIDLHNMSIALILDSLNSTMYDSFNEIAAALLNMSNSTINISMDMEDLYRRIRNIVFTQTEPTRLESQARIVTAGFFPIAAAQSLYITNSTCLGNTSLRQFYVESVMITDTTGTDYLNVTRHLDTECAFGCDSAMAIPVCKASPLSNALYFFAFIGIMIAAAGLIYTRYYK